MATCNSLQFLPKEKCQRKSWWCCRVDSSLEKKGVVCFDNLQTSELKIDAPSAPKTVGLHVAMSSVKSAPISHFPWELLIEWPSTRPCNPPRHPLEDPIPRTTIELHLAGLVA